MSSLFTRDLPSSVRAWAYTLSLERRRVRKTRFDQCASPYRLLANPQKLGVGIRVDVPAGLDVEELAQLVDVDEVSVDAHADAERSVHFEGGQLYFHADRWRCRARSSSGCRTVKGLRLGPVMCGRGQKMRKSLCIISGVTRLLRHIRRGGASSRVSQVANAEVSWQLLKTGSVTHDPEVGYGFDQLILRRFYGHWRRRRCRYELRD